MQLNQFQSHFTNSPMILDDQSEHFFEYQQSIEGSELGLMALPMTKYAKSSLDGIFQIPMTALPDSNPFGPFLSSADYAAYPPDLIVSAGQDSDPEYQSDSDFGYSIDNVHQNVYQHNGPQMAYSVLPQASSSNAQVSRKRKASPEEGYFEQQVKRVAAVRAPMRNPRADFHDVDGQACLYPGYSSTAANPGYVGTPAQINSPRRGHHHSTSTASHASLAAPSPHTPAFSPSFTTVKTEHSPRPPMTPAPRPASTSSPYLQGQVKLVRTSTIPQQATTAIGPSMGNVHSQPFNPYYLPHKATLHLNGDLDGVARKWSEEELEVRRKLIVFNRTQLGSTIDAEFKTVAPQDWNRQDITVNCIWWKEKQEAFVTSVDTISLLEQLIAVRFTVEEKNRIRRNLEGFRPLTVSKSKADSEDFFKVIMGFPNPKPRNIEKDVKVFPWKILGHALKKIISKYSASYASTSAMISPAGAVYGGRERSAEYPVEVPQSQTLMSNVPQTCSMSMPDFEHGMVVSSMPVTGSLPLNELALQVPGMNPQYEMMNPAGMYTSGPMPMSMPMGVHSHQMTPHSAGPTHTITGNWSYAPGPSDTSRYQMPYSAPPSAYPHGHIETANLMHAAGYQLLKR